jgi:hypothetical protein
VASRSGRLAIDALVAASTPQSPYDSSAARRSSNTASPMRWRVAPGNSTRQADSGRGDGMVWGTDAPWLPGENEDEANHPATFARAASTDRL